MQIISIIEIFSYRQGTGGGVDKELETAIAKGMDEMTEDDIVVARELEREASFAGLRVAESTVLTVSHLLVQDW